MALNEVDGHPKYRWRGRLDEDTYADRGIHVIISQWQYEILFMHKYTRVSFVYNKKFRTFRIRREWGGWYFSEMSVNVRGEVIGQVRQ